MSRNWAPKKKTVELEAAAAPRPSRIRREPPPRTTKQTVVPDRDESDRWLAVVGIITFALALCVLAVAFAGYTGWSPTQYSLKVSASE